MASKAGVVAQDIKCANLCATWTKSLRANAPVPNI